MKIFSKLTDLTGSHLENDQIVMTKGKDAPYDGQGGFYQVTSEVTDLSLLSGNYAKDFPLRSLTYETDAYTINNAMYSWWARPMSLRYTEDGYNITVQSFVEKKGKVGINIHDHESNTSKRYILDEDRTVDDHNAGCVAIGDGKIVAVYGGRSNTIAPSNECLVCEWDIDDTPYGPSFHKYYLAVGRDYPTMYQYDNDTILISSQRGGPGGETTGHSFMTNSWPLDEASWSSLTALTDQSLVPDWMYMTSRRNTINPNYIDLAFGFHPEFQTNANVYVAQVRHVGGATPWRLYVNGIEIANMSTGSGLPISLSDLELAYDAGGTEKTRLYDVKNDSFVITSYIGTDTTNSVYKYVSKSSGSWTDITLGNCGDPFLETSAYFGGAVLDDVDDKIAVGENVNGFFRFSRYSSLDGGTTWTKNDEYSQGYQTGENIIHGRPLSENRSLATHQRQDPVKTQLYGWVGRYSSTSFTDFATSIITLNPLSHKDITGFETNGAALSSKEARFKGDLQAIIASEDTEITDRFRSAALADSGSTIDGRNSAVVASRNMTLTGLKASGITDNWILGSFASNEGTVAKDYSALIGTDACSIDVPDSLGVRLNVITSSENCNIDNNSSFAFLGSSKDSGISGDFSAILSSEGCSAAQSPIGNKGHATILSSIDSTAADSRTHIISSNSSQANGAGGGVQSSQQSVANGAASIVMSSFNCQQENAYTISGGVDFTGTASTSNRKWQISSQTGNALFSGTVTQDHTFADIAKMFENGEDLEIESGYLLKLVGDKVYKAVEGEKVDAIVASTPSVIHNDTPFHWQGRYQLDEFGKKITEKKTFVSYDKYSGPHTIGKEVPFNAVFFIKTIEADGEVKEMDWVEWPSTRKEAKEFINIPSFAEVLEVDCPLENPNYVPSTDNTPRSERPDEWTTAGVHGVIRTRVDSSVTQEAVDEASSSRSTLFLEQGTLPGIGRVSSEETNIKVLKVTKEYDGEYGVAVCYLS